MGWELIRVDLRKAAFPYEGDSGGNSLFVTDAMIDGWLAAVGLIPVWVLGEHLGDQMFAKATPGTKGTSSVFPVFPLGTAAAGTVKVRAIVYPEGTFQFFDGGELNLGVVRDFALNAVNKCHFFGGIRRGRNARL